MPDMSVTCETSQVEMPPLNSAALWNMLDMSVTCETLQLVRGWLNAEAL